MNEVLNRPLASRDEALVQIQNRALCLAVQMVYHANKARTVSARMMSIGKANWRTMFLSTMHCW